MDAGDRRLRAPRRSVAPLTHHARAAARDARRRHAGRVDRTATQRYHEKLATPDVTIADLIGDIDPIKAATRRLDFADEEVIHYGIIPRTNRGIFAINELPDLQPRIQVGPAEHSRGEGRPDPRLPGAHSARHAARVLGQPRGLHEPRQHHHAAARPHRVADHDALPAARARTA